jgi:Flp pilus assembly protein protease CpaA
MGELKTELSTIIPAGIILLADIVLAVAAIILSIRTKLKRSTYKVWFLIIAVFFILQFGWGLIGTIGDFKTLQIYEPFATNRAQYYNVIGNSLIWLIYGALAIVAIMLSRRFSTKTKYPSISK